MKTVTNQRLRDIFGPCFSALSTTYQAAIISPAHKIYLVLKALNVFFIELGIDWKKVVKALLVVLFFSISSVVFFKLFTRALDIEFAAQDAVVIEHQELLKKSLPFEDQ